MKTDLEESSMKFTKMHGLGNDYVYVNCLKEHIENPPAAARFISDRHFGIGSDGLIMINPSKQAAPAERCAATVSAVWQNMFTITD